MLPDEVLVYRTVSYRRTPPGESLVHGAVTVLGLQLRGRHAGPLAGQGEEKRGGRGREKERKTEKREKMRGRAVVFGKEKGEKMRERNARTETCKTPQLFVAFVWARPTNEHKKTKKAGKMSRDRNALSNLSRKIALFLAPRRGETRGNVSATDLVSHWNY